MLPTATHMKVEAVLLAIPPWPCSQAAPFSSPVPLLNATSHYHRLLLYPDAVFSGLG